MAKKNADPIPEQFRSYEEAAEFWDTHDTTDYPEALRTVEATSEMRGRHYEVEIDGQVVNALKSRARKRGVTVSRLASDLLRQELANKAD